MMVRNTRFSIFLIALITSITLSLAKKNIEEFFEQFGYLPQSNGTDRGHDIPPEQIELAISKFQRFNGLKVTGILDEPTKRKMYQPRCGVKDIFDKGGSFRKVSKWSKTNLTWSLKQFSATSRLTHRQQLTAIKNALNHWASVTPLTFTEVPHGGDIDIRFAAADHGDGYSFDGPGGVLAHAFFPSNGNTHFDDSEEWTIHSKEGIDLEIVAAHEFGHALGLAHSQVSTSLMAPYYRGYIPNFKLDPDDVRGIQSLYGVVNRRLTRPSVTKTTTIRPPWGFGYCNHRYTRIDATIRVLGRVDYVFVDHKFVISSKTGRKKPIRNVFGKGPARVEAALYSIETNKVYLAYDDKFWAYTVLATGTRFELDVGYPKKLTNNMAIHMNALMGMDMSYSHYKSVRIFILKDKYFWELIPSHNYVTRGRGYQIIKFFPNAPKRFDSILSINDVVYFLSNNMFYRMKVSERHVSSTGIPLKKVLLTCRNR